MDAIEITETNRMFQLNDLNLLITQFFVILSPEPLPLQLMQRYASFPSLENKSGIQGHEGLRSIVYPRR